MQDWTETENMQDKNKEDKSLQSWWKSSRLDLWRIWPYMIEEAG